MCSVNWKSIACLSLSLPLAGAAFEESPWLGQPLEFRWDMAYTYSQYSKVQDALIPLRHTSHDHLFVFGIDAPLSEFWDTGIELEITDTPRETWRTRSFGAEIRRLWLNDIEGDFITLTTGAIFRYVPLVPIQDISTPYHYRFNYELNAAVGKEWEQEGFWRFRTFGFFGAGIANRGSPWIRADLAVGFNQEERFQYELFTRTYWGFGEQKEVNIEHFHGYARIHHQSIDLGVNLRYILEVWGSFSFEYAHRVYARSFPESVNFFTVRYQLPFCLF